MKANNASQSLSAIDPRWKREEIGSLPCYLTDFDRWRARWALESKHLLWLLEGSQAEMAAPRPWRPGVSAREFSRVDSGAGSSKTRLRFDRARLAIAEQHQHLASLLSPLKPEGVSALEFVFYLKGRTHNEPVLWTHFDYLHRDWGWGENENTINLEAVVSLFDNAAKPKRLLVPGGGACRLAYDLHRTLEPSHTYVTDLNPLLLLCASEIVSGNTLQLYEFTRHPLNLDCFAVPRVLRAPFGRVPPGFNLVLTDFNKPCFVSESFDCVVTSWFIDAAPIDMERLFALINRLLVSNGVWINVGPTMFNALPALSYTVDEVLDSVAASGFSLEDRFERFIPTLNSPISATQRFDRILGFRAAKIATVDEPNDEPRAASVPEWLTDTSLPVRVIGNLREFARAHEVTAEVLTAAEMGLSIDQIVDRIATTLQLSHDTARAFTERTLRSAIGL